MHGIVVCATTGLRQGTNYEASQKIFVEFKENFEKSDIEEISKEIFGEDKYKVDYIDKFKAGVIISVQDITNEQKENLENKLKEKYTSFKDEENAEEHNHNEILYKIEMAETKSYDIVRDYIKPMIIVAIVTIVFFSVVFRKIGIVKSVVIPAIIILGINALYISIIAITRLPINEYIVTGETFVYGMSLILTCIYTKGIKEKTKITNS